MPAHDAAGLDALGSDPDTGGFRVETDAGEYTTRYLLTATAYDGDLFEPFADEVGTAADHGFVDSDAGRTAVEGLYAVGWMTDESVHQAVVNAGHGARAALSLIRDDISARFWPAVGEHHVDWVVHEGRYDREDWSDHTREEFTDEILRDDVPEALAEEALAHLRAEFRARELDAEACDRREREGQRRLLDHIDDDLIAEYAESSLDAESQALD